MTPLEASAATPAVARSLAAAGLTLCLDAFPWACFECWDPRGRRFLISAAGRTRLDSLDDLVDLDVVEHWPGPQQAHPLARGVRLADAVQTLLEHTVDGPAEAAC